MHAAMFGNCLNEVAIDRLVGHFVNFRTNCKACQGMRKLSRCSRVQLTLWQFAISEQVVSLALSKLPHWRRTNAIETISKQMVMQAVMFGNGLNDVAWISPAALTRMRHPFRYAGFRRWHDKTD